MRIKQYPKSNKYLVVFSRHIKYNMRQTSSKSRLNIKNNTYWIIIQEPCRLQYYFFKSLNLFLTRLCKGLIVYRFFVHFRTPLTSKVGIRMGTGKGKLKYWVANFKKGDIIMSIESIIFHPHRISKFFSILSYKFPVKIKVIKPLI